MRKKFNYDFVGKTFGIYEVINELDPKYYNGHKSRQYECKCSICGANRVVSRRTLTSGNTTKCTCSKNSSKTRQKLHIAPGMDFYGVTVIEYAGDVMDSQGYTRKTYLCECVCGTLRIINAKHLNQRKSYRCNCKNRIKRGNGNDVLPIRPTDNHPSDLTGIRVGLLTILDGTTNECICKCECGNIKNINRKHLISKSPTNSCGCYKSSFLELNVANILERHGVRFNTEVSFDGLVGVSGVRYLRFDFEVFDKSNNKVLIECQGKQHYEGNDFFGDFDTLMIHDELKRNFAQENGILLILIPYWENNEHYITKILSDYNII